MPFIWEVSIALKKQFKADTSITLLEVRIFLLFISSEVNWEQITLLN